MKTYFLTSLVFFLLLGGCQYQLRGQINVDSTKTIALSFDEKGKKLAEVIGEITNHSWDEISSQNAEISLYIKNLEETERIFAYDVSGLELEKELIVTAEFSIRGENGKENPFFASSRRIMLANPFNPVLEEEEKLILFKELTKTVAEEIIHRAFVIASDGTGG